MNKSSRRYLWMALALVLGGLLWAGCNPFDPTIYVGPGKSVDFKQEVVFYAARLPTNLPPSTVAILKDYNEQQKIDFLVRLTNQYLNLPAEVAAGLVKDARWSVPAGITVNNPQVSLVPVKLTWKESMGNDETTYTVEGQMLAFTCQLSAAAGASTGRGKLEVSLPNFALLKAGGIYVLNGGKITWMERGTLDINNTINLSTRPTYLPTPEVVGLGEVEIK